MAIGKRIIEMTMKNGATIAGIASMEALKLSASHVIYDEMGDYAGGGTVKDDALPGNQLFNWWDTILSVLVISLAHPFGRPEVLLTFCQKLVKLEIWKHFTTDGI